MNYRPATSQDVGRTDVEFANRDNNNSWSQPAKLTQITTGKLGNSYIASDVYPFPFARVPILPEECKQNGKVLSMQHVEGRLSDDEMLSMTNQLDPERYHKQVTIRRKLEAGGLAEAEQAILVEGRFYPIAWVKS